MSDTRKKNASWTVCHPGQQSVSFAAAQLAVLMDIRDEMQTLNRLLACPNFIGMPSVLRSIDRKLTKKRVRKK